MFVLRNDGNTSSMRMMMGLLPPYLSSILILFFVSPLIITSSTFVYGQGKVPMGDYTTELPMKSIQEAIEECEHSSACAGFTFKQSDRLDMEKFFYDATGPNLIIGSFVLDNDVTDTDTAATAMCRTSQKDFVHDFDAYGFNQYEDEEEEEDEDVDVDVDVDVYEDKYDEFIFDYEDDEEGIDDDDDWQEEEGENVYFHGFIPKLKSKNYSSWITYRSSKQFVFHRGKLIPSKMGTLHTIEYIGLDEAREHCISMKECVGFTFNDNQEGEEQNFVDLYKIANVSFASSVHKVVDNNGYDQWRTYLSNDELHAKSINHHKLNFDDDEITEPYSSCCNRNLLSLPSIEDVKAMDTLERVSCSISREEFYEKYEKQRKPVMLVGCDEGWPAQKEWTFDNLSIRFGNNTNWRAQVSKGGDTEDNTLWRSIIQAQKNNDHYYIFDPLDHPDVLSMRKDYETPPQFRDVDLYTNMKYPPNYGSMRWFCAGSKYSGTYPHEDPHGTDAWNTVLSGHKWWILYPMNSTEEEAVECNDECSVKGATELHWYASVGIHAARNEYGPKNERPQHILQKAGETIYVPFGMIHSVMNMDETVAVTRNYASPGNLQRVWQELLEEDTNRYWKHLYNNVLKKEQRQIIRNGPFWPPEQYVKQFFEEMESSDDGDGDGDGDDEEEESMDIANTKSSRQEQADTKPSHQDASTKSSLQTSPNKEEEEDDEFEDILSKYKLKHDYSHITKVPDDVKTWIKSITPQKLNLYRDSDGNPALHLLVMKNFHKAAEYLIVQGEADVNVQDENGVTPLDVAIYNKLFKMKGLLARYGAKKGDRDNYIFNGKDYFGGGGGGGGGGHRK